LTRVSVLDPKGPVADQQKDLILLSIGFMLFIVGVVFANIAIKSNGLNALNKKITILPIDVVNLKCTFSKSSERTCSRPAERSDSLVNRIYAVHCRRRIRTIYNQTTANIAIKSNGLNALNKKITILPIDVVNLKCTFSTLGRKKDEL
jgi:hypothetical protein